VEVCADAEARRVYLYFGLFSVENTPTPYRSVFLVFKLAFGRVPGRFFDVSVVWEERILACVGECDVRVVVPAARARWGASLSWLKQKEALWS
jgi:hypothetical protein